MGKAYYSARIGEFVNEDVNSIVGALNVIKDFDREIEQQVAWEREIAILKDVFSVHSEWANGYISFEYEIPRLCGRIDAVVLLGNTIFVIEFKVGERQYPADAKKQVLEYCFDLKYFHSVSKVLPIVPILVCTEATDGEIGDGNIWNDVRKVSCCCDGNGIATVLEKYFDCSGDQIALNNWFESKYAPTPTIVEAAIALYEHHDVKDITKTSDDDNATNLTKTTAELKKIIAEAHESGAKKICFVTGVPGAGKTLVGLNLATDRDLNAEVGANPVFLSGNGPLVSVLQHALQKDAMKRKRMIKRLLKERGKKDPPEEVAQYFSFALKKTFVQGIYGFLKNAIDGGESDCRIAIFDEAQRCWNKQQMTHKHNKDMPSEASCLVGQMSKNSGWSVVICLVGGGQEIHTGESGIVEWFKAVAKEYPEWEVYVSDVLQNNPGPFEVDLPDPEDKVGYQIKQLVKDGRFHVVHDLHLGVNLRSFRSERVSDFANALVENNPEDARKLLKEIVANGFPVKLTRNLDLAKRWVREKAKRVDNLYLERYGAVASSGASRIRPEGITVPGIEMDVPKWMLGSEQEVDSSYFLELAASEFKIQGLEIDYSLMIWESDYRFDSDINEFAHKEFRAGREWRCIKNKTRQNYLKNAYRVLLTRARQGMVIYVPLGSKEDQTRVPGNYNGTYQYLKGIGIEEIE